VTDLERAVVVRPPTVPAGEETRTRVRLERTTDGVHGRQCSTDIPAARSDNCPVIKIEGLVGLVTFALWVFCLVEVISTPDTRMRNLPKVGWVLIVLLFPLVGSIAWLVAGRPESGSNRPSAYERPVPQFPEYDRPGRAAAVDPEKDEEFLRQIRERAEEQRKRYEQSRRPKPEDPEPTVE
jgi:hypothetical protein